MNPTQSLSIKAGIYSAVYGGFMVLMSAGLAILYYEWDLVNIIAADGAADLLLLLTPFGLAIGFWEVFKYLLCLLAELRSQLGLPNPKTRNPIIAALPSYIGGSLLHSVILFSETEEVDQFVIPLLGGVWLTVLVAAGLQLLLKKEFISKFARMLEQQSKPDQSDPAETINPPDNDSDQNPQ